MGGAPPRRAAHPTTRSRTMPKVILPPSAWKRLLRKRRLFGADRFDEVWNGVYVLTALADNQHQELAGRLTTGFVQAMSGVPGIRVLPGANISDNPADWSRNLPLPRRCDLSPRQPRRGSRDALARRTRLRGRDRQP